MIRLVVGLALVAALSSWPTSLLGQSPFQVDSTAPYVLERSVRDRWIRGSQDQRFVPFGEHRDWIHLRRTVLSGGRTPSHRMEVKLGNLEAGLGLEPDNRVRYLVLTASGPMIRGSETRERRAYNRRGRLTIPDATFSLPESRLWELTFVVPPQPLREGLTWSDTLEYVADPGEGLYQEMEGVWDHRVVGDTLVGDMRLPIVVSRADVRFTSLEPTMDFAMKGAYVINREVSGTITGRAVVDTVLGVRALGMDTLAWEGTSTLELQDGRAISAPVRYEGTRRWALRDSLTWVALRDSLTEERRRQNTGMLILPTSDMEERMAAGDTLLADSIRSAWQSTDDPNERRQLWRLYSLWGSRSGRDRTEMEDWRTARLMEMGDTAGILTELLESRQPTTVDDVEFLLPYLDDLERFWRVGMDPQFHHGQLATNLFNSSPLTEPDTARWRCEPTACERLVGLVETAREPRLRDAALVGAFARDPERWYDAVRARAEAGSRSAEDALNIANGAPRSDFFRSPRAPLPGPGAHWRSWLEWMGGRVAFATNHRKALTLYRATHDRDPVEELRAAWPPESDSAQAVLGAILQGMEALPHPTLDELSEEFLSGSEARASAAAVQLRARFYADQTAKADPALGLELAGPLLDSIIAGGSSPWPRPDLSRRQEQPVAMGWTVNFHGVAGVPLFLLDKELPPGLADAAPGGLQVISPEEWEERPKRAGGVILTLHPAQVAGPFASIRWDWYAYRAREADEAPSGFAGGGTLFLLRTEDGWRVVTEEAWIT